MKKKTPFKNSKVMKNDRDIIKRDEAARKRKAAKWKGHDFKGPQLLEEERKKTRREEWEGKPLRLDDGKNKKLDQFEDDGTD